MNRSLTIQIQPSNDLDLETKQKALQTIAMLDTDTITFLGELANSPKAVSKLNNNKKLIRNLVK